MYLYISSIGNVYIADSGNYHIRKITASTGIISSVAGSSTNVGFSGDGGAATAATMSSPNGIALDSAGKFFIFVFISSITYYYYFTLRRKFIYCGF